MADLDKMKQITPYLKRLIETYQKGDEVNMSYFGFSIDEFKMFAE